MKADQLPLFRDEIFFRGVSVIPISRLTPRVEKDLTADPKRSRSAPGKKTTFQVYKTIGKHLLVPKYKYAAGVGIGLAVKSDKIIHAVQDRPPEPKFKFVGDLLEEQKAGTEAAVKALEKWNGVTIQGKCGSGKTVVGTWFLAKVCSHRSIVLVDQIHVAEQWAETIHKFIPGASISFVMPTADQRKICKKVGIPATGRTKVDTRGDIVIVMAQTLFRNGSIEEPLQASLLIVDEAHKFSAPTFADTIFRISFQYSISLTATPDRADGLEWVFMDCLGPVIVHLEGRTMDPVVFKIDAPLFTRIDQKDHASYFCTAMYKPISKWACSKMCQITDICQNREGSGSKILFSEMWERLANDVTYNIFLLQIVYALWKTGRHALIFSKFRNHLTYLYEQIIKSVPEEDASLFFGGMNKEPCLKPRLTFTTYKNTEHAIDAPHKDAALLAMPVTRVEQTIGRALRYREGKRQPIIIDPLIQSVDTFRYQHESHLKFYRNEGYGIVICRDTSDLLARLHHCY